MREFVLTRVEERQGSFQTEGLLKDDYRPSFGSHLINKITIGNFSLTLETVLVAEISILRIRYPVARPRDIEALHVLPCCSRLHSATASHGNRRE